MIRLDYRGRGRSDWADPATYTIPVEARDALDLLDHLGIAAAPILGTSRGGLIGMTIAATAKDRLSGLCLVDVGPVLEAEGLQTIVGYIGKSPSHKTHAAAAAERVRGLRREIVETPLPDLWPLYDALDDLPVAVSRVDNSELLSAATVEEMAARRPDLVVATVPWRGHVPFLDEPESVAAIRAWLGRLS